MFSSSSCIIWAQYHDLCTSLNHISIVGICLSLLFYLRFQFISVSFQCHLPISVRCRYLSYIRLSRSISVSKFSSHSQSCFYLLSSSRSLVSNFSFHLILLFLSSVLSSIKQSILSSRCLGFPWFGFLRFPFASSVQSILDCRKLSNYVILSSKKSIIVPKLVPPVAKVVSATPRIWI